MSGQMGLEFIKRGFSKFFASYETLQATVINILGFPGAGGFDVDVIRIIRIRTRIGTRIGTRVGAGPTVTLC